MSAFSVSVDCWRHGTVLKTIAVGLDHEGELHIKVEMCPDCKREEFQLGKVSVQKGLLVIPPRKDV